MAKKQKVRDSDDHEAKPDIYGSFNAVLDEVARKMSDADTLDDVVPMSTGSLTLDLIMGGGIRPAMYTNFGPEQSAKTTGALLVMASAIKQNVPIVSLRDFEGCVTRDTLISCEGRNRRLDEIFCVDGWEEAASGHWYNQFAEVDTLDLEKPTGVKTRVARLYYKGVQPITKVLLDNGSQLTGNGHLVFVVNNDGDLEERKMEDLLPGDKVLIRKDTV